MNEQEPTTPIPAYAADRLVAQRTHLTGDVETSTRLLDTLVNSLTEDDLADALVEHGFSPDEQAISDANSLVIQRVDKAVQNVAKHLPFEAKLMAEMGGDFVLQIDLGWRGDPNTSHDRAGINRDDPKATWWIDAYEIDYTATSTLDIHTPPEQVARWITEQALKIGSPAVQHLAATMKSHAQNFPGAPTITPASNTPQPRAGTVAQQQPRAAESTPER